MGLFIEFVHLVPPGAYSKQCAKRAALAAQRADRACGPFFIFALPRCRTLWAANLLTWSAAHCYHELGADVHSWEHFKQVMEYSAPERDFTGNCGTDNLLLQEEIFTAFPQAAYVYLERSIEPIQESLARLGLPLLTVDVVHLAMLCKRKVRECGGLVIDVDRWAEKDTRVLWNHCLPGIHFPEERNKQLAFTKSEITGERWQHFHSKAGKWPFVGKIMKDEL